MSRYKPCDPHASMLLPVVLSEQLVPGRFAFALNYLVDHELDLSALGCALQERRGGRQRLCDPRVMLKIVLLAYSVGLISSRSIAAACVRNVQFIALSGDSQPWMDENTLVTPRHPSERRPSIHRAADKRHN